MINPSIMFTSISVPPFRPGEATYTFLGFSRYEKESQITLESWKELTSSVSKVFDIIRKKYNLCSCYTPSIQFTWDDTEVGICLKKLELRKMKELSEISMRRVDEIPQSRKKDFFETIKKFTLRRFADKGIDYSHSTELSTPHQIELNKFAITTLCETVSKIGVEKPRILEQVRQIKDKGYLSPQSFYELQLTVLKA